MAWPSLMESAVIGNFIGLVFFGVKSYISKNDRKNDEVSELKTEVALLNEKHENLEKWVQSVSCTVKDHAKANQRTAENLAVLSEIVKRMGK